MTKRTSKSDLHASQTAEPLQLKITDPRAECLALLQPCSSLAVGFLHPLSSLSASVFCSADERTAGLIAGVQPTRVSNSTRGPGLRSAVRRCYNKSEGRGLLLEICLKYEPAPAQGRHSDAILCTCLLALNVQLWLLALSPPVHGSSRNHIPNHDLGPHARPSCAAK